MEEKKMKIELKESKDKRTSNNKISHQTNNKGNDKIILSSTLPIIISPRKNIPGDENILSTSPKGLNNVNRRTRGGVMSLEERLSLASLEAKIEIKLLQLRQSVNIADQERKKDNVLQHADMTLSSGMRTLHMLKVNQSELMSKSLPLPASKSRTLTGNLSSPGGSGPGSGSRTLPGTGLGPGSATNITPGTLSPFKGTLGLGSASTDSYTDVSVGINKNIFQTKSKIKKKEIPSPLQLFYDDPAVKDIQTFRGLIQSSSGNGGGGIGAGSGSGSDGVTQSSITAIDNPFGSNSEKEIQKEEIVQLSVAWQEKNMQRELNDNAKKKQRWSDGVSADVSAKYTQKILDYRNQKKEILLEKFNLLQFELQCDIIAAKNRKLKDAQEEEEMKNKETKESMEFGRKFIAEKKNKLAEKRKNEKLERKRVQGERVQARINAEENRLLKAYQKEMDDKAYKESLILEKERMLVHANKPGVQISNRAKVEMKMKIIEDEKALILFEKNKEIAKKKYELVNTQKKTREDVDNMTGRLRMGNFDYHGGVLGFYNDVRADPVPWVEFVDSYGVSLYLDPLTQKR